jgi:hypothetical protein
MPYNGVGNIGIVSDGVLGQTFGNSMGFIRSAIKTQHARDESMSDVGTRRDKTFEADQNESPS